MVNKYYNAIAKIKIKEDLKNDLILKLKQEKEKSRVRKKEEVFMKIKRIIIAIVSVLAMLIGSGVVYASLGGTINGVPALEWMGIKFSDNYINYVEPVENQFVKNEEVKITLESTVADEGFTILQFRVNISEEKLNSYKTIEDIEKEWEVPLCYLSFNDPVIEQDGYKYAKLGGANYRLIIDGEEKWVRGSSAQSIEKISEKEYLVYQMWFLDEKSLGGKEDYEITLKDIAIGLGEECISVEGIFDVEISKEKALKDTTTIIPKDNTTLRYKSMEKSIEKISITPLQNIIKVRSVYKDIDTEGLTYALDEDYVGMVNYIAFDKNNNIISTYATQTEARITYEDGTIEEGIPGEFEFKRKQFEHATYEIVEMIAIEQSDERKEVKLTAYESLDYNNTVKKIMEYKINLNTNKIQSKNKNVFIYDPNNSIVTEEYKIYCKKFNGIEYVDETIDESNVNEIMELRENFIEY